MFFGLTFLLASLPPATPPVCDADLLAFPGEEEVLRQLEFSAGHLEFLEEHRATHSEGGAFDSWRSEAHWCHDCWEALYDARRHDFRSMRWWVDGDQLRWLRDQIGARNYYQGRMPPAVPSWRFSDASK